MPTGNAEIALTLLRSCQLIDRLTAERDEARHERDELDELLKALLRELTGSESTAGLTVEQLGRVRERIEGRGVAV